MERRVASFESSDKDFWKNIEQLRNSFIIFSRKNENSVSSNSIIENRKDNVKSDNSNLQCVSKDLLQNSKQEVLAKINKVFQQFIHNRENKKCLTLSVPNRSVWKNVNFEKDQGIKLIENPTMKTVGKGGLASSRRIVLMQHILTQIYKLIETDSYKTKRELYYDDVGLYGSQSIVDSLLDDIACLLQVSKIHLHVLTTSKGCVAGRLRFKDGDGNYIDCTDTVHGVLIPSNVQKLNITDICSDAKVILVVEKSAVFEMLIDNNITSLLYPCILITGKGFPDVNTRELLRKLSDSLQIPILGLFDADPYGIEILGIYKYGSKAMAFDVGNLAVPEMRWLGLLPTDIDRLRLPLKATLPLSENDKKKAKHLLELPYVQHHKQWLNEIEVMLRINKKAEIEGLGKLNDRFLSSIYLPNKLKYGGWI